MERMIKKADPARTRSRKSREIHVLDAERCFESSMDDEVPDPFFLPYLLQ
jgi:hypothetical protein